MRSSPSSSSPSVNHHLQDAEARAEILAPVAEQNVRIERHIQRRGAAPRVDPTTGEVRDEDTPESPAAEEAADSDTDMDHVVTDNQPEPTTE